MYGLLFVKDSIDTIENLTKKNITIGNWNISPKANINQKERPIKLFIPKIGCILSVAKLIEKFINSGNTKAIQTDTPQTNKKLETKTAIFKNFLSFSYSAGNKNFHTLYII